MLRKSMRLARLILGAVVAIVMAYLAAALTVGPGDTHAHLCALVGRIPWLSGVGCQGNLGSIVFSVVLVIATVCVVAIFYDIWRWGISKWRGSRYLPLLEAAQLAHDQVSDDIADIGRHTYSGNRADQILVWWGYLFARRKL